MASVLDDIREKIGSGRFDTTWLYGIGVAIVFFYALWVRYIPAGNMEYLQALDPYMIARMSAGIIEQGALPFVDAWRFFPYATPTYLLNLGNIYIPAYLFYIARVFGFSFLSWAKFYPALMGALAVIPVYLVITKIFDRKTGLFSAFFLASSPAIMHRSSAGWFEKEPVANFFMMTSLYFFVKGWMDDEWWPGIASGVSLAIAATSWGGTNFMFLLYPVVVMFVVFVVPLLGYLPSVLYGDGLKPLPSIRGLFRAFAPTAILGTILPFIWNGSASTWTIPNTFFLLNMGVLAVLSIRYAADRFDWVEKTSLPSVSIWTVFGGGILALLAPLYSQWLAGNINSIIGQALQSGGSVIGGTVAENQPASISQVVSQLGAVNSAQFLPSAQRYSEYFSGWTFGILGFSFLVVVLLLLIRRAYFDTKKINEYSLLGGVMITVSTLSLLFYNLFPGTQPQAFVPLLTITGLGGMAYFLARYISELDAEQWILATVGAWVLLFAFSAYNMFFTPLALLGMVAGLFVVLMTGPEFGRDVSIGQHWAIVIILLMVASTVYGSMQRSRLLFLAATPVAIVAGVGFSKLFDLVMDSRFWETLLGEVDPDQMVKKGLTVFLILAVVTINVAAVYAMGSGLGGSPNSRWMENLDYMREETPPGSVILSWWDYGYWFETIGERPAVADGGNMGYYASNTNNVSKINYPLADFLTSSNPRNWTDWLESMSVDYIVLDNTMIGKYTAVSTISKRGGTPESMMQLSCVQQRTGDGRVTCRQSQMGNNTVMHYTGRTLRQMFGGGAQLLLPVERQGQNSVGLAGTPLIRAGGQTIRVANFCSDAGISRIASESGTQGSLGEAMVSAYRNQRPFGGCIAFDPARGAAGAVVVPPSIMESSLVRLYLMDGAGMDFVENVFDNGFARMWKVTG